MDYLFQYEVYSKLVGNREDKRSDVDLNERDSQDEEENPQYWKATIGNQQLMNQRFGYDQESLIRDFTLIPSYTQNVDLKKVSVRKRDCLIITTKKIDVKERETDSKKKKKQSQISMLITMDELRTYLK